MGMWFPQNEKGKVTKGKGEGAAEGQGGQGRIRPAFIQGGGEEEEKMGQTIDRIVHLEKSRSR